VAINQAQKRPLPKRGLRLRVTVLSGLPARVAQVLGRLAQVVLARVRSALQVARLSPDRAPPVREWRVRLAEQLVLQLEAVRLAAASLECPRWLGVVVREAWVQAEGLQLGAAEWRQRVLVRVRLGRLRSRRKT
jgi:hypothetical protein